MTRVLSGAALLAFAIAVVWFAPPILFLAVAELLLVGAFVELAQLAAASGLGVPRVAAGTAAALTSLGLTSASWLGDVARAMPTLDAAIMTAFVALASLTLMRWRGGPDALGLAAASVFPSLYLGLPIGAMVSVRESRGREALFLLIVTIVVSDTAQYYTGRAAGRRALAPAISPTKTIEGAVGGFVLAGVWWLPNVAVLLRALLGVAVVALGIAGDLFESMLKRSSGVKDSSSLIPGHGGILDRIDALLFAAPVYYIVLKYV